MTLLDPEQTMENVSHSKMAEKLGLWCEMKKQQHFSETKCTCQHQMYTYVANKQIKSKEKAAFNHAVVGVSQFT